MLGYRTDPAAESAAIAPLGSRRLGALIAPESRAKRWGFFVLALAITFAYFYFVSSYGAAAHPGVDQNGYQVGGRLFSETFSTGMRTSNPYSYVGWMWVKVGDADSAGRVWYYPKYPLGLPVIDAMCLWIAPLFGADGVAWVYRVSPVCCAIAVLAMFLMVRLAAGSFAGILAMLLLATSPVALVLANNSNSHAPALAFVTVGMLFVIWWWQRGGWWRGAIAGFLLGYAVTIRYTEGLLVIPLILVALLTLRWKDLRSYLRASVPLIAWLAPVAVQVVFNKAAMGSWTGYDTTNESTGFSFKDFQDKWQYMLEQLNGTGLFFLMPLGVFGLALMFRWSWRLALLIAMWFVPGVIAYTAYYWGLKTPGLAYLRFFMTLIPAMIFSTAWLFAYAGRILSPSVDGVADPVLTASATPSTAHTGISAPIAAGVIVAIAAGVSLYTNIGALERDFSVQMNLADVGHRLRTKLPDESDPAKRAILFGEQRLLLNYIQSAGRFECYSQDAFNTRYAMRIASGADPDAPNPLQRDRINYTAQVYKGKTDAELIKIQNQLVADAINRNRRVFVALPSSFIPLFKNRFITKGFTTETIEKWREPVEMSAAGRKALANLGPAAGWYGRGTPQLWEILEIKRK